MIRKMVKEDLIRIMEIEQASFKDAWTLSEYEYELEDNPFASLFVYEEDGKIVGMYDIWVTFEIAQIANIAVDHSCRGKGIGSKMMDALIDYANAKQCENISLEVRVTNQTAIALYEKYDFMISHTRKQYYEDGEDAYLMIKELGGEFDEG